MSRAGLIDLRSLESGPAGPVMESLGVARRQLATAWLTLPREQVRTAYLDELGRLHRLLIDGGVRDQLPTQLDVPVIQQVAQHLGQAGTPSPGALLAAALFFYPHQFSRVISLDQVPEYLVDAHLRFSLATPVLFRQEGEADLFSRYLGTWLSYLNQGITANPISPVWRSIASFAATSANLISAYFTAANLRDLLASRGRLIEQTLGFAGHQLDHSFGPRPNRAKIRLGILAAHFLPQTETFATLPVYRHLDREKFEVILITLAATGHPLEKFCAAQADQFVSLPQALPEQAQAIRNADIDILWIATNVTAVTNGITLLAAHRLARMQVASVCSCVTTGLKNVDYYLSGRLSEPASGAQEHYTEQLLTIDGPAHCYDFATETISAATAGSISRAELGIDEKAVVFASGANFFKILPELDDLWARILAATPGSRLLLYPFNPNWTNVYPVRPFLQRMQAYFARQGVSADRLLIFGQAPSRADVLARLRVADVYLDSYPFAGATSLLDPLELGLPSLVMEGTSFRSLVGPALLRDLKLDEFVAPDPKAYISLAVKLATDEAYRAEAKRRFGAAMAGGPKFFDGKWYSKQVGETLTRAWETMPRSS